jgi:phage shock protein A
MERMTQSITETVSQALKLYVDQCMQDQESAAQARELESQASRDALEKKILEKIEDDNSFLLGEVQSQKRAISALRTLVENVSTEVTKLAEQVSLQNALKAEASEQITSEHLDEVWHHLTALQEAVLGSFCTHRSPVR